jgi:7-carboxy-7-deazaguanine synthase
VERSPGRRDWVTVQSPAPVEEVTDAADDLWRALPHHSVSLTGGEPLFQRTAPVLAAALAGRGHRLYLETNGMLGAALERAAPYLSHVSMDVKLTSVDGQRVPLERHRHFLATAARSVPHVFCKIVLGAGTEPAELEPAVAMIAATAPDVEVFLQPVTPFAGSGRAPAPEQVLELQAAALRLHPHVRVVPQTHKALGQL